MSIKIIQDSLVCSNCNQKFLNKSEVLQRYYCNSHLECDMYLIYFDVDTIAIYSASNKNIGIYIYYSNIFKLYSLSFPSGGTKRLAYIINVEEFDLSEKKLNDFIFLSQEIINKFYKLNKNILFL